MSTTDDPRTEGAEREACASCGEPSIHRIILRGEPTPVCLRHLNHWETPTPVPHTEGVGAGDVEGQIFTDKLFEWLTEFGVADAHVNAQKVARSFLRDGWTPDRAAARAEGARSVSQRVTGWVNEFIVDYDIEHNEGCEGEPDCIACVLLDVRRAALTDPAPDTTASEEER